MPYDEYLMHFNKNHNTKNGQFDFGDGDGDGISNDHAHRSKNFFSNLFNRDHVRQGKIKVRQLRDKTTWTVQGDPKSIEMAAAMVDLWSKANL